MIFSTKTPGPKTSRLIPNILDQGWMGKADLASLVMPQFSLMCSGLSRLLAGSNFLQILGGANRPISPVSRPLTRLETLQSALMSKGLPGYCLDVCNSAPSRKFCQSISSRYSSEGFFSIILFHLQLHLWLSVFFSCWPVFVTGICVLSGSEPK